MALHLLFKPALHFGFDLGVECDDLLLHCSSAKESGIAFSDGGGGVNDDWWRGAACSWSLLVRHDVLRAMG